jgi:hypothetical protein
MSTITQETPSAAPERRRWVGELAVRELWAGVAIAFMWIAVLFSAVFGPDFVSTSSGGNATTIPSAVFVAFFAALASRWVARYGFGRPDREAD